MRRLVTLFIVWASLAQAADPAAPSPVAPSGGAVAPAPPPAATPPALPSAREAEERLALELGSKLTVGRSVELQVAGRAVLGLYTPQSAPKAKGALILLHDFGGHADWPGVIAPLRRALPAWGWSTLSVQLPLPDTGPAAAQRSAYLDQVAPRVDAALAFLKSEGQLNVVIAGHGLGAAGALDYAANHPEGVRGVILVGLPYLRGADPRFNGELLSRVQLPMLDLYGTRDRDEIGATAPQRRQAAGHGGNYIQIGAPATDHFFTGQAASVTSRVRGWLDRHADGTELPRPERAETIDPTNTTTANVTKGSPP